MGTEPLEKDVDSESGIRDEGNAKGKCQGVFGNKYMFPKLSN